MFYDKMDIFSLLFGGSIVHTLYINVLCVYVDIYRVIKKTLDSNLRLSWKEFENNEE